MWAAASAELGAAAIDNRRLQLCKGIDEALTRSAPLSIVVYGNLAAEVAQIALPNGHTYRPWPRPYRRDGLVMMDEWRQLFSSIFELHAEIPLDHEPSESAGDLLLRIESTISADIAAMSLAFGASLRWFAASVQGSDALTQRQPLTTRTHSIATEDSLEPLMSFSCALDRMSIRDRAAVAAAIEWHRLGNESVSLLASFLCHWIAIERHAQWWCNRFSLTRTDKTIVSARTKIRLAFDHLVQLGRSDPLG